MKLLQGSGPEIPMNPLEQRQIQKYASLIEGVIPPVILFDDQLETPSLIEVERATVFPQCLLREPAQDDVNRLHRLVRQAELPGVRGVKIVNRLGQNRAAYRPLLVYASAQVFNIIKPILPVPERARWDRAMQGWGGLMRQEGPRLNLKDTEVLASAGPKAVLAAWNAMALQAIEVARGRSSWETGGTSDDVNFLFRCQSATGSFLTL